MLADDLSAPLGLNKTPPRRTPVWVSLVRVVAGALSLAIVVVAGWALITDDPFGGEPIVVVSANLRADTAIRRPEEASLISPLPVNIEGLNPDSPAAATVEPPPAAPPGSRIITIIDGTSGKRQDVVIPG